MGTTATTARFEFCDTILEGEVVDREPTGRYNQSPQDMLTIAVDGAGYRVLESELLSR